jgi:hypothetical protein
VSGRRYNVWIKEDNVFFWDNLDNKSGWINYVIEQFIESAAKKQLMEEQYGKDEETMVQDTPTEVEG